MTAAIVDAAVRCPLGASVDEVVRRWQAGGTAAVPDPAGGATAPLPPPTPGPHLRLLAPCAAPAWDVAHELLSRQPPSSPHRPAPERTGLFFGYGGLRVPWAELAPALEHQRPDTTDSWERGLKLLHPFWMLRNLSNGLPGLLAPAHAVRGDGVTTAGPTAGVQALAAALRSLAAGACDAALVLAADDLTAPEVLLERVARGTPGAAGAAGAGLWLVRRDDAPDAPWLEVTTATRRLDGPPLHLAPATGDVGAAGALVGAAVAWRLGAGADPEGRWRVTGR